MRQRLRPRQEGRGFLADEGRHTVCSQGKGGVRLCCDRVAQGRRGRGMPRGVSRGKRGGARLLDHPEASAPRALAGRRRRRTRMARCRFRVGEGGRCRGVCKRMGCEPDRVLRWDRGAWRGRGRLTLLLRWRWWRWRRRWRLLLCGPLIQLQGSGDGCCGNDEQRGIPEGLKMWVDRV